jgi:pantothenate kinase
MIGIAGAPGAGKSTYAAAYVAELTVPASYLPMDGFHLADVSLRRLGLLDRKGAPETFDAWGFAALLGRLRDPEPHPVYAPGFERDLEQPVAAAIAVPPEAEVVVTEGNYLLLDRPEWRAVRAALDEVWFLDVDDAVRRERLVARHVRFGKTPSEAERWVATVDEPNARLVAASRPRADRWLASGRGEPK